METNFTDEIVDIVSSARNYVAKSANLAHVASWWLIGQKVFIEEQNGKNRADYGKYVVETVSNTLTEKFGSGYSKTNIKNFRTFYQLFSDFTISQALPDQLKIESINKQTTDIKIFPNSGHIMSDLFAWIDLKSEQITHQDVGQMDMYVRMYDELKCSPEDNPTIGLLLCSETSSDLARYSILKDKDQIFQAKYLTYLPTKEQLKLEIEKQKEIMEIKSDSSEL